MKKLILLLAALHICTLAFTQEVGKKVYKQVNVNGELLYKLVKVYSITEYDSNGNKIHFKNSRDYENWCEYDSNGNKIHYKNNNSKEEWYEYTYWDNGKVKTKTEFSTF